MTDPDGDRVGLGYKDKNGKYQTLTGNQSAPILMDYMFSMKKARHQLPKDGVMYNTIVTSPLGAKVAAAYGIKTEAFLTGFKFIGSRIDYYEKHGGPEFVFGYEESYGCLAAPFARDKDGLQAILLYAEMALFYYLQGKTLDVVWEELGARFGYHEDKVFSMSFEGSSGFNKMKELMNELRNNPLQEIDGSKVVTVEDYLKKVRVSNGKETKIDLPKSDVMKFICEDGTSVAVRPSGTEPKVKFYIGAVGKDLTSSATKPDQIYSNLKKALGI